MHGDAVKMVGSAPALLIAYGAYGECLEPDFQAARLPLLARGWVLAFAHSRGGGELGRRWGNCQIVAVLMHCSGFRRGAAAAAVFSTRLACAHVRGGGEFGGRNKYSPQFAFCVSMLLPLTAAGIDMLLTCPHAGFWDEYCYSLRLLHPQSSRSTKTAVSSAPQATDHCKQQ